jgi:hypothetical protein
MTIMQAVLLCLAGVLGGTSAASFYWARKFTKLSKVLSDLEWFEAHGTSSQKYSDGFWTLWSDEHFSSSESILEAAHYVRKARTLR